MMRVSRICHPPPEKEATRAHARRPASMPTTAGHFFARGVGNLDAVFLVLVVEAGGSPPEAARVLLHPADFSKARMMATVRASPGTTDSPAGHVPKGIRPPRREEGRRPLSPKGTMEVFRPQNASEPGDHPSLQGVFQLADVSGQEYRRMRGGIRMQGHRGMPWRGAELPERIVMARIGMSSRRSRRGGDVVWSTP
jgi:hypothetical protein